MNKKKKKKSNKRNKQKTLKQNPYFANLPQDLINDILVRLPVKTLVSCRYVCKLWLCLISNPIFINTHLQKSNLSNNCSDHKLMFSLSRCDGPYGGSFIKSLSLDHESNVVVLDYPTIDPLNRAKIIGSCNGLVCIYTAKVGIFIWNPCTGISKKLRHSGLKFHHNQLSGYGFGYDPFSDDYKVVLMVYAGSSSAPYYFKHKTKRAVKTYSLKSNSWGEIGYLHGCGDSLLYAGHYVNGVLHWALLYSVLAKFKPVIVSLDLGNETFGEIEQPCYGEGCEPYMGLGVLKGCLSVFCHIRTADIKFCTKVWVMKEYGVRDTWTKLYTIPYTAIHIGVSLSFYRPLCISMTGEILLDYGGCLVLYNPNNGSFRNPNYSDWSGASQALTYVESLVSPNIYEEVSITQH